MAGNTEIAFTTAVKSQQERRGSRPAYARWEENRGFGREISPELAAFLAERDSFYLGTASGEGQPYIQHRGGPPGVLRVLDERTLAFADFAGNRQYISIGNLSENPRAYLFVMDYATATRYKIWGTAEFVEDDPELVASLSDPEYGGVPERAIRFTIEAWDRNCRQHIPKLVPAEAVAEVKAEKEALADRVAELEHELARLREAA